MSSSSSSNPEQLQEKIQEQQQRPSLIKPRIFPPSEGVAPQTGIFYQRALNNFKDFIKIHDDQVLLDFSPKVIKQMIVDYILYLRDEKPGKRLGRNSIKGQLSGILHWFQINNDDFNLTSKNFRIHLPSDDSVPDDRGYTSDEIAQILRGCDKRSAAVIHLLCSGLRIGAIHPLQVDDIIEVKYNQDTLLYKVRVYARTRSEYYTFTTPEGYSAIREYLDERIRNKENLKDKSPLIREQYNKDNIIMMDYPRFVTQKAIEWMVDNRLKVANIRKPKEVHLSHGFRKRFATECELSGMKPMNVSMLMGHSTGVRGKYFRPNELAVLEDFMTYAVDALTINENNRLRTQISQLQIQNQKSMKEFHDELLSDLKNNYALIPQREWETIKCEMKFVREKMLPEYYKSTGVPIHLDANYADSE
jgi:integrase